MSTRPGVVSSMYPLWPREAGEYIAPRSEFVKVIKEKCKDVAELIMDDLVDGKISDIDYKSNPLHPTDMPESYILNWVFFLDVLNFSFWPNDGEQYEVEYKGKKEVGYLAMCAAFMKAHDNGFVLFNPNVAMGMSKEHLDMVLKSDSGHSIPMIEERFQVFQEAALHLLTKYEGLYQNMVIQFGSSAQSLLKPITMIHSFCDQAEFRGQAVYFLKRAQILLADTYSVLKDSPNKAWVDWKDLDTLTMFADYRVPQVLSYFGCLEYNDKLMEELQKNTVFKLGDQKEVEIRGNSIFCVQEIYEEVKKLRAAGYREVNYDEQRAILPIDIDVWLWQYRRDHAEDVESLTPMHRTRSIYY